MTAFKFNFKLNFKVELQVLDSEFRDLIKVSITGMIIMMMMLGSDSESESDIRETSCASIAFNFLKLKNFNLNAIDAQLFTLMPSSHRDWQ